MTDPVEYLTEHVDQPRAWVLVFGGCLTVTGAVVAFPEYGFQGAALCALAAGAGGAVIGGVFGGAIWLCLRRVGGAERLVRRPDLWALPLACTVCSWRTSPEGPWRVRDCVRWPETCPECGAPVLFQPPTCPCCSGSVMRGATVPQRMASLVRWPRNLRSALWGDVTCRDCGGGFDKWGRELRS